MSSGLPSSLGVRASASFCITAVRGMRLISLCSYRAL